MVLFTLSVFALLLFLWVSFGGVLPLKAQGYRFKADFPEAALLAKEADVRIAGVNVGKVKSTELGPGGRRHARRDGDRRPLRADQDGHARHPAPEEPARGDVRRADPGPGRQRGPPGRRGAARRQRGRTPSSSTRCSGRSIRRRGATSRSGCTTPGSPRRGEFASDLNDSLGNAAPFFKGGADLLRPLDEQEVALRRVVRDTGRTFHAISRENGQLRGADHERRGDLLGALRRATTRWRRRSRSCRPSCARRATTVGRLEQLRAQHRPARARPARARRRPGADAARPRRPVARPRAPVQRGRAAGGRLGDGRARPPRASCAGAEPVLASTHTFLRRAQPDPGLPLVQPQPGSASSSRQAAPTLAGTGVGGYRANGAGRALPAPDGDHRRAARCCNGPRGRHGSARNAYVAPNAYPRAIPLGVIESFDCNPSGGEQRNPSGSGGTAAPPCFVAPRRSSRTRSTRACGPRHAPVVDAPRGTQGNSPARP